MFGPLNLHKSEFRAFYIDITTTGRTAPAVLAAFAAFRRTEPEALDKCLVKFARVLLPGSFEKIEKNHCHRCCMLAFCKGVAMPFPPSHLNASGDGILAVVAVQAGRYVSPEENAFFPYNLPSLNYTLVLHPPGASININDKILNLYLKKKLLPLITSEGDDGNYAVTAASDLDVCGHFPEVHLGKFVAEVKFRDSPRDYTPTIHAMDRDALMELLTFISVEVAIKKRVEKKTKILG